jgi:uncharacterized repeat protein (TIGR03803 family)
MRSETISVICISALLLVLGLGLVATPPVQAQTFSVVHNFAGYDDGATALAGLTIDKKGVLYGTASAGGAGNGVVYEINQGNYSVLYSFAGGTDGASPQSSLVFDAEGHLYGTTFSGGASGAGTVYKVTKKGKETVLYSFTGATDGGSPIARLAIDKTGNLYGTTTAGGANGNGAVFKLVRPKAGGQWKEKVLYSFGSGDGTVPVSGVTLDAKGNVYGTDSAGGTYGYGTVFELTHSKSGWTESILYQFQNQNDGGTPYGGLTFDSKGNLYGSATQGGSGGGGTVFELTRSGSGWAFNVLYPVPGWGISGTFRDLLFDKSGNIYATTHCDGDNSDGTVYELSPSSNGWIPNVLYQFTGGNDGLYVFSNLVMDANGNLYGTNSEGGVNSVGVIYEIQP